MVCTLESGVEPDCDDSGGLLLPPPHPKVNIDVTANPNGRNIPERNALIVYPPGELPQANLGEERLFPSTIACARLFALRGRAAQSATARGHGVGRAAPEQL